MVIETRLVSKFLYRFLPNRVCPRLLCLVFSFLIGCGGTGAIQEKLVPASGMVQLDGKPTEGVTLTFLPIAATKSAGGNWATTDKDGKYKVMTASNKEGIPPGQYQVLLSLKVKADGSPLGKNESPTMVQSRELIAPMYSDPGKLGLHNKIDVPEKGANNLDFKVTSAPVKKKK